VALNKRWAAPNMDCGAPHTVPVQTPSLPDISGVSLRLNQPPDTHDTAAPTTGDAWAAYVVRNSTAHSGAVPIYSPNVALANKVNN
jgi:hypothetical protein